MRRNKFIQSLEKMYANISENKKEFNRQSLNFTINFFFYKISTNQNSSLENLRAFLDNLLYNFVNSTDINVTFSGYIVERCLLAGES